MVTNLANPGRKISGNLTEVGSPHINLFETPVLYSDEFVEIRGQAVYPLGFISPHNHAKEKVTEIIYIGNNYLDELATYYPGLDENPHKFSGVSGWAFDTKNKEESYVLSPVVTTPIGVRYPVHGSKEELAHGEWVCVKANDKKLHYKGLTNRGDVIIHSFDKNILNGNDSGVLEVILSKELSELRKQVPNPSVVIGLSLAVGVDDKTYKSFAKSEYEGSMVGFDRYVAISK